MKRKRHRTTIRNFAFAGTFLILFLCVNSCQKEEGGGNGQTFSEQFFAYNGQTNLTEVVIGYLRAKNDTVPFVEKFAERYGMPMWRGAVDLYEEEQITLFVPVYKKGQAEIENIWIFRIRNGSIGYSVMQRRNAQSENAWAFDYMTQETLKRKPKSGVRFEIETFPNTRALWGENIHCVQSFAGVEYQGNYIEVSTGWRCWTEFVYDIDNPNHFDDPGWGECKGCMKRSPVQVDGGVGGGYMPGTPEVIPDKSPDNPDYKNVKEVFDCIVMNAPSTFVKNMLNRFYGTNAEFDITYLVGEMPAGYENSTGLCDFSASGSNGYKNGSITFNKNKLNTSSIELISTLLHETLHAYIHSYLYSKDPSLKKTTLDEAFNLYEEKLKQGATVNQEHNFMAANWVNTMTGELQRFHSTQESYNRFWNYVNIADENDRKLFYEAMVWSGLEGTNAYGRLLPEYKTKMIYIYAKNKESLPISWKCD